MLCGGCSSFSYGTRQNVNGRATFHTIRKGDTLSGIAARYKVDVGQIVLLNGIRTSTVLHPGESLLVRYAYGTGYDGGPTGGKPTSGINTGRGWSGRGAKPNYASWGGPVTKGRLAWPVEDGHRISSWFGNRSGAHHDGIDIAAPEGAPVYAAHDGVVVYAAGGLSGYGNLVLLRAADGFTTVYAHNRRILVEDGMKIRRGQKISEVGSTGHSSGPHLHFEVRRPDRNGNYIAEDPIPYFLTASVVPGSRINESLTPIIKRPS
ncbi:MAG: M23 family metallopeptidase [bacterium]|nr:M23 family metallopeptidase [bacterium]